MESVIYAISILGQIIEIVVPLIMGLLTKHCCIAIFYIQLPSVHVTLAAIMFLSNGNELSDSYLVLENTQVAIRSFGLETS